MSGIPHLDGRLGLVGAKIPHVDRHGLLFLSRGQLSVNAGTLEFECAGSDDLEAGLYTIPYQRVSMICLGPGSTVSHDALRIMCNHGTLLTTIGDGGVKFYSAPAWGRADSDVARRHAEAWSQPATRLDVARKMYAIRFGRILPHRDIAVLRGIEGGHIKEAYKLLAIKYGIQWGGRRYDRQAPEAADQPNQAINHAATFVEAAAEIAVAAVGALPPLGFIHEHSSNAFTLDIADLFRTSVTVPIAFQSVAKMEKRHADNLERVVRYEAAAQFRSSRLIATMIDRIKDLLSC